MYITGATPMKPRTRQTQRPEWARALVARRHALGLRQEDIAERTHEVITQGTMSDLERGKVKPTQMTYERFVAYLHALEWTPQEFAQATALNYPHDYEASHIIPNLLEPPRGLGNFVSVEVLQAQGGIKESHDDSRGRTGAKFVDIPESLLNGNNPADCLLVEIFGDSMSCEDVRLSIGEGSQVIVNRAETPQSGDIIVADLYHEDEWKRVLKIVDREGHIVLRSYNDKHTPIVLAEGMELVKIGVYVNHTGPGRQAMRRINRERLGIR